ncbi:MAG: hypothetical protein DMF09_02200 [Verrucomicrobia bacterium]|nr:MAG: hypothetical protein DMF09_02200 [Verrucomicrobiota bacterium]
MAIIPWRRGNQRWLAEREGEPFSYLRQQINRVFDDFWGEPWLVRGETWSGFAPQVTLRIRGEKKYQREENEKGQYRMERSYGSFERAIPLPVEVDEAKAKAEFKNGVLRLTLPKRPGAQSRRKKIPVK